MGHRSSWLVEHAPRVLGIGAWLVVAVIAVSQGHRAATAVAAGFDLHQVIVAGQALRSRAGARTRSTPRR